jgi:hypothetical protein
VAERVKLFSVEEANRTLPLVRRIVQDIVQAHAAWTRVVQRFEVAAASSRAESPHPEAETLQRDAEVLAREIQEFVEELQDLGVEFKGFELGLVDFPSEREGRPVFLCWKLGEDAVSFWHEVDEGYAGRRPLVQRSHLNGSVE